MRPSHTLLLVLTTSIVGTAARVADRAHRPEPRAEGEGAAVTVARAHIDAWSHHDWARSRESLAPDVHVTAMTTQPGIPPTDLVGVDRYMAGLKQFATPIVPGSAKVLSAVGDDHNALVIVTAKMAGPNGTTIVLRGARLYLVGDDKRIKAEQVLFYLAPK